MHDVTQQFVWSFPGGAWGLAAAAAVGAVLVAVSYLWTFVRLPPRARVMLSALRVLAVAVVLAALCRPTLVEEVRTRPREKPKVAVVLDESGSMHVRSAMGTTRAERAERYHRRLARHAEHLDLHAFAFAETLRELPTDAPQPAPAPPSDAAGGDPAAPLGTHLHASVAQWVERFAAEGYDGVVCLTDALDTSDEPRQTAIEALRQASLPHAFVAIDTPLPSPPLVELTKLEAASTAQVGTEAAVSMLIQASGLPPERDLEVVVEGPAGSGGDGVVHRAPIRHIEHASVTEAVSFEVPVPAAQTLVYTASVRSAGQTLASARWSVQGLANEKPRVLLYAGAMDWGARQLRDTFERGQNAELEFRWHPAALGTLQRPAADDRFPGPTELARYDAVILLNVNRRQVTPRIEAALEEFVRKGGGLLMLNANPAAAMELAASPLERLLPVEFESFADGGRRVHADTEALIRPAQGRSGGAAWATVDVRLQQMAPGVSDAPPLHPFRLTREGRVSPIFGFLANAAPDDPMLPRFESYAPVRRAKPGARVLAVHDDGAGERVLLAVQSFGQGRTALLATDTLWRWRLGTDSESYAYAQFWRQLVNYLATGGGGRQPAWLLNSVIHPSGEPAELHYRLPSGMDFTLEDLDFAALSPDGELALTLAPTADPEVYRATLKPKPGATYHLVARRDGEVLSEAFITGRTGGVAEELRRLRPDPVALAELAAASRGVLLDPDQDYDWANWLPVEQPEVVKATRTPLWNTPWVFAALLGLFLTELAVRRWYRLV